MSNFNYDSLDLHEAQGIYSDFYKDVHGFRPRFHTTEEWNDREFIIKQIEELHDYMDNLRKTPEGRAQLREEGWSIDEKDYV